MLNVSQNVKAETARPEGALGIEALALAKKLPPSFLRGLGLCDLPSNSGVGISYYDETGAPVATKRCTALKAEEGSYWPKDVPVCAYGRRRINAEAAEQKISQRSLWRAKDRPGIVSLFIPAKDGHGGTWAWFRPAPSESEPAA
jgi:hypothetical protein